MPDFVKFDVETGNMIVKPSQIQKAGDYTMKITRKNAAGKLETKEVVITIEADAQAPKCELDVSDFTIPYQGTPAMMMFMREKKSPGFVAKNISTKLGTNCPKD